MLETYVVTCQEGEQAWQKACLQAILALCCAGLYQVAKDGKARCGESL